MAIQAAGPHLESCAHEARLVLNKSDAPRFSLTSWGQVKELFEGLYLILFRPKELFTMVGSILKTCAGYLLVAAAFLVFMVFNEGIVVGDRSAHQVVLHPTQVLYFFAFCLCFTAPFSISRLEPFYDMVKKHWLLTSIFVAIVISVIQSYSLAHPYLLADNRHYTFYIWRRIIARTPYTKYVLLPVYIYAGYCTLHAL